MHRSTILPLLTIMTALFLGSCASMLNGKEQKMIITTDHVDNEVYVDDSLIGTGRSVDVPFKRDFSAKEIRIEREGQESKTYAEIQTKKSPLYFFSIVPFGVTFYSVFFDSHPKAFNYNKVLPEYSAGGERMEKTEEQKYIYVNNAAVNIPTGKLKSEGLDYRKYAKGNMDFNGYGQTNTASVNFKTIAVQDLLNDILKERNYIDTSGTILKKKTNTMYVDAEVVGFSSYNIYRSFVNAGATSFMYGEIEVKWTLRDVYKQVLFESTLVTETDQHRGVTYGYVGTNNSTKGTSENILSNALEKSLIEFLRLEDVQLLLPKNEEEELLDTYSISKSAKEAKTLTEAMHATVTVKLKNDSHGSGFFINENHIVTNFHVVAGQDTVEIVNNDGEKIEGIVIRSSAQHDLAIIKIKEANEFCFSLNSVVPGELGGDVYAIGTPTSLELTQTLSKGIISGRRKTEEVELIQTDVSINPGNSGGPLVNPQGKLVAVVNAKLVGSSIEGIGFGIPAEKIIDFLKLEVK